MGAGVHDDRTTLDACGAVFRHAVELAVFAERGDGSDLDAAGAGRGRLAVALAPVTLKLNAEHHDGVGRGQNRIQVV
jgi:hypothetical protein